MLVNAMLDAGANPDVHLGTPAKPAVQKQVDVTKKAADLRKPLLPLWSAMAYSCNPYGERHCSCKLTRSWSCRFAVEHHHVQLTALLLSYGASVEPYAAGKPRAGEMGWSALQNLAAAGKLSAKVSQHLLKLSASLHQSGGGGGGGGGGVHRGAVEAEVAALRKAVGSGTPLSADDNRIGELIHKLDAGYIPPELKARTPAHTKQLGWYVEFGSRVTQVLGRPARDHDGAVPVLAALRAVPRARVGRRGVAHQGPPTPKPGPGETLPLSRVFTAFDLCLHCLCLVSSPPFVSCLHCICS